MLSERFQHGPGNNDMFVENFDTSARVVFDTLYYPTVSFDAHLMKVSNIHNIMYLYIFHKV